MLRRAWILIAAVSAYALAAGLHLALAASEGRARPWLAAAPGVLALAALVGLMVSAAVLTWRARGARRVGVLALHVLLVGGALLGIYTAVVRDLFGDTVEDDLALPDGRHAYLYRGFFCTRVVRIAEPWALFTREALTQASTCEVSARLAWDADAGQVRVLGPDGEPLPPPEPLRLFPVR